MTHALCSITLCAVLAAGTAHAQPGSQGGVQDDPNDRYDCVDLRDEGGVVAPIRVYNLCDEMIQVIWCAENASDVACDRANRSFPRLEIGPKGWADFGPYSGSPIPRNVEVRYWACLDPWTPNPPVRRNGEMVSSHCRW